MDYVLFRRHEEFGMKNCMMMPGEACLTQHRLLWAEVVIWEEKRGFGRGKENLSLEAKGSYEEKNV